MKWATSLSQLDSGQNSGCPAGGIAPLEVLVSFDENSPGNLGFLERMELVRQVQMQLQEHSEISGAISLARTSGVRFAPN